MLKLSNLEIMYLIKFRSCVTRFFYFHFFKNVTKELRKLAMTSQFI